MRKWLVIPLILAMLSVAIMGGMALAQDGEPEPPPAKLTINERAAELLNVTPEELEAAFKQAKSEARTAKIESHLQALVDKELIDQAQADQYKEWLGNMPEGFDLFLDGRGLGDFEFLIPKFKGFDDHVFGEFEFRIPRFEGFDGRKFGDFEFRFPQFKGFDNHRFDFPDFGGKDWMKWFREGRFHPQPQGDGT